MSTTFKLFILVLSLIFIIVSFKYDSKNNDLYLLQYPIYFGAKAQNQNDTLKKSIITLGRFLFYDVRLSGDNSTSCGSCHNQKFAFSDSSKFSKGATGVTTRNSMSLTNLLWQSTYFWDGRAYSLEEQALIPIQNKIEMNQSIESLIDELSSIPMYQKMFLKAYHSKEITATKIAKAIAQFEKTIISSNSKFDQYLSGDTLVFNENEKKGYALFSSNPNAYTGIRGAGCSNCHNSSLLLGHDFQNNGLDSLFNDPGIGKFNDSETQVGKFKVPSLRNIAVTSPYMHDGRFENLREVLSHYNKHVKNSPSLAPFLLYTSNDINKKQLNLTEQEIQDIISFLNTLTDHSLAKKKEYSNPFN